MLFVVQSDFYLSFKSNSRLLWFCFTLLCDWLTKLTPLSQPMKTKTKSNGLLHARIFPPLAPVACNDVCFCSDWFMKLSSLLVIGQSSYFGFGFTNNWPLLVTVPNAVAQNSHLKKTRKHHTKRRKSYLRAALAGTTSLDRVIVAVNFNSIKPSWLQQGFLGKCMKKQTHNQNLPKAATETQVSFFLSPSSLPGRIRWKAW